MEKKKVRMITLEETKVIRALRKNDQNANNASLNLSTVTFTSNGLGRATCRCCGNIIKYSESGIKVHNWVFRRGFAMPRYAKIGKEGHKKNSIGTIYIHASERDCTPNEGLTISQDQLHNIIRKFQELARTGQI